MNIAPEMQAKISEYLDAVAVQTRGRPEPVRRELLSDLERHIHEALQARGGDQPTMDQLDGVLTEMDPPEAFADSAAATCLLNGNDGSADGAGNCPSTTGGRRLHLVWLGLALCALVLNACWYWQWRQQQDDTGAVVVRSASIKNGETVAGNAPLSWTFGARMVTDAECETPLNSPPAKLQPNVYGRWQWRRGNCLLFLPEASWPLCTEFTAEFAPGLTALDGRSVRTPQPLHFTTVPLTFEGARQVGIQTEYGRSLITLELAFNAAPEIESLKRNLSVISWPQEGTEARPQSVESVGQTETSRVLIQVTPADAKLPAAVSVNLKAGVQPAAGTRGLAADVNTVLQLTDSFFLVKSVPVSPAFGSCGLLLGFSQPPAPDALAGAIEIKPEVKFTVTPLDSYYWEGGESITNGVRLTGAFVAAQMYELTVRQALRSQEGTPLARDITRQVLFPERKPTLALAREGRYLPPQGSLNVVMQAVNLSDCSVTLRPVLPQNLVFYALRETERRNWWGDHREESAAASLTGVPVTRTYALAGKPNEVQKLVVNLAEFMGEKPSRGVWLLSATSGPKTARDVHVPIISRLLVVSDLGVVIKTGAEGAMVWVNALPTTAPVAGAEVVVYARNNTVLARGATAVDGTVNLVYNSGTDGEMDAPFVVTVTSGEDFTFLPLEGAAVEPGPGTGGEPYLAADGCEAFVFAGRGIYRPGETLHAKALVRTVKLEAPKPFPVVFRITKPDGKVYRDLPVQLNTLGAAECEMELPAYLPTGRYRVALVMPGTFTELGETSVRLEEFAPPQITITQEKLPARVAADQEFEFEVVSRYLFGRAADGLRAEARILYEPTGFKPAPAWQAYRFRDDAKQYSGSRRDLGFVLLDAEGRGKFKAPGQGAVRPPSAIRAWVETVVLEAGGRPVTATGEVMIDAYPYYLGVKMARDNGLLRVGEAQKLLVVAVGPDGAKIQPESNRLKAVLTRVTWNNVLRRNANGSYSWQSERVFFLESDGALKMADGTGEYSFTPQQSGEYWLTVTDPFTGVSANLAFTAAEPEQTWVSWAHDKPDRVELSLDRKSYRPGETANLLIRAPFSGLALLTLEADRVLEHRFVQIVKNTAEVELPVRAEFAPNVYAVVNLVRPAVAEAVWSAHRAVGALALPVEPDDHRLVVELTAPEQIRPQTTLPVKISTRDSQGKGMPAEVTVMAVDEGICRLTDFVTPDPLTGFLAQRGLAVETSDLYSLLMPLLTEDVTGAAAHTGGDGGAGLALMRRLTPVRANRFKPVALWQGAVASNADGVAEVRLDVPEFSGQLRLMAVAYDQRRTGTAERAVIVKRPLIVQPGLPRFAAPGDHFNASLTVFNETGAEQEIKYSVTCGGLLSAAQPEGKLTLANGASRQVLVELTAGTKPGKALCTVLVTAGAERYEETVELPVRPAAAPVTLTYTGTLAANAEFKPPLPAVLLPETAFWSAHASSQPELKLLRGLDYLLRYPYGCLEQTTSSVFPLLYLEDLVAYNRPRGLDRGETAPFVQAGILRLLCMQRADGGFSMWPGASESAGWAGVYATHFLVEAQKAGYQVPGDRLEAAVIWLKGRLDQSLTAAENSLAWQEAMEERAYACLVLARAGRPNPSWMARLQEQAPLLRLSTRAQIAVALLYAGQPQAAATLLGTVSADTAANAPLRTAGVIPASRIRDTALLLAAWVELDPKNPVVPRLIAALDKFQVQGHWYTTQDDAVVLMALGRYARSVPPDRTPFAAQFRADSATPLAFSREQPLQWWSAQPGATQKIGLTNDGPGTCYYQVSVEGVPAGGIVPAVDLGGLKVRRQFLDAQGKPLAKPECSLGDRLTVLIALEAEGDNLNGIVINDLLPAGLEIENPSTPPAEDKQAHAWVVAKDVRDDRLLLFTGAMSGRRRYAYTVRAVTSGEFTVPAITAEAMYDPEVRSAHGQGRLTVKGL